MAADPMETLRLIDTPEAPRALFAENLRARVESALGVAPTKGTEMVKTVNNMRTVTPYLTCKGAAEAIGFYVDILGAVEVGERIIDQTDGRIGHATFTIGDTMLMISDEYPEMGVLSPKTLGGTPVALNTYVEDCDASYARAVAAGATGLREPADQFYGSRSSAILDPWGHRWMLETVIEGRPVPTLEGGFDVVPVARTVAPLGYFALRVADTARASTFFGALFGWEVEPNGHIANIDPPGGFFQGGDDPIVLYIQVPDVEAAAARVRELGGAVLSTASYESGANARCTDDQGTPFDLFQPNPGYERA